MRITERHESIITFRDEDRNIQVILTKIGEVITTTEIDIRGYGSGHRIVVGGIKDIKILRDLLSHVINSMEEEPK